ncbi:hypothetical protein [Azospirillum sp. sgz301742]
MNGQRQDGTRKTEAGKDQAAGKKPEQGGGKKLDDETSKAQEDAARERAEKGGYQ